MSTKAPPAPATQIQPPDEKFWIKYSHHHEMTISGMASLAWHTLAIVLMVVLAWVVAGRNGDEMPIEMVDFTGPGAGIPKGTGSDNTIARGSPLVEAVDPSTLPREVKMPTEPLQDITGLPITPRDLLPVEDKDSDRALQMSIEHGTQALQKLAQMDKKIRDGLMPGRRGSPNGTEDGGEGNVIGGTNGPSGGSGVRVKRQIRWTITFTTQSGDDYLRQVHILGAILAFQTPEGGDPVCVKDLMGRPVKFEKEDLKKLNRIFWIDDRPDSVAQLARAMGLNFVPDRIYALFPYTLEKELLRKELAFKNRKEEEILETRFQILMRGNGYEIYVLDQRLNQ
jgi:hypothetical protein